MDPLELRRARYARMRGNTPLSLDHADKRLERLGAEPGEQLLDLAAMAGGRICTP